MNFLDIFTNTIDATYELIIFLRGLLVISLVSRIGVEIKTDLSDALVCSALPTILVSCKCDNPIVSRQIDVESVEAACMAEIQTVKTASNVPESARLCLGAMLRAIMAHRNCTLSFQNSFFDCV